MTTLQLLQEYLPKPDALDGTTFDPFITDELLEVYGELSSMDQYAELDFINVVQDFSKDTDCVYEGASVSKSVKETSDNSQNHLTVDSDKTDEFYLNDDTWFGEELRKYQEKARVEKVSENSDDEIKVVCTVKRSHLKKKKK